MQLMFEALASPVRRKILAYLAHAELNAGDIAARFDMSKPSISQHLALLEGAGLVTSEKRGKFVFYRQNSESLANTLAGFVQEVLSRGAAASEGEREAGGEGGGRNGAGRLVDQQS